MAKNKKKLKMSGKPQVKPQEVGDPKSIDAPRDLPIWTVSIVFLLTTVIFFWDQLVGNAFFWEDFTEQVYPLQAFAARIFSNGDIPFWNSFTFSGMPLFADLQVGFFYPLNRLASLFLDADGVLTIGGLQIIIILHFFIAQLSMYSLMRYLKISSIGAMIGAVSFAFSFVMVCHVFHPMMVYHLAWFPLVIMYFMRGYSESNIKFTIISGLIFGGSMLAGHPQTMLYESLFLGIMFLWFFFSDIKKRALKGSKLFVKIAAGLLPVIIAVGIFSIQYLPAKEFADNSARAERSFEESAEGSLESGQIFTSVVPKFFGFIDGAGDQSLPWHLKGAENKYYLYWDTSFYFGITALMLGLFGAVRRLKTREGAFFLFIAVFGLLFALGDNFIIYEMFYNLPFFGLLRIPARIMFFAVIGFSVLAGFGFDELRKSTSTEHLSALVKSTFAIDELRKKANKNFLIVFAVTFGSVLL
ncbi:MAG: hypothetical protein KAH48_03555, partial [Chlorobi bacterium]|nr:hypothetical protein [Chlorobiota bacterium]